MNKQKTRRPTAFEKAAVKRLKAMHQKGFPEDFAEQLEEAAYNEELASDISKTVEYSAKILSDSKRYFFYSVLLFSISVGVTIVTELI